MARRKRKDSEATAGIDGDPQFDTVYGKDPAKAYALVSVEDMPRLVNRGFTRTLASPDGPKAAYGLPSDDGSEIKVNGQLVLMEAPKERAEAAQRKGELEFARRTAGLREQIQDHIRNNPGVPGGQQYKVAANHRAEG